MRRQSYESGEIRTAEFLGQSRGLSSQDREESANREGEPGHLLWMLPGSSRVLISTCVRPSRVE